MTEHVERFSPESLTSATLAPFFGTEHAALAERLGPIAQEIAATPHRSPHSLVQNLGDHGLLGLLAPGPDEPLDVRKLVLVREALGYASPLADALFAVQGLGSYPIALAGDDEQRRRLLPPLLAGEQIGAFALTEPEAGSDVAALRTRAEPGLGGHHHLFGDKTLISNAPIADRFVVFATTDPAAGQAAISAFVVERGASGLDVEVQSLSGDHPLGKIRFDGCPAEPIGAPGGGFRLAMQTLDAFRITVGAAASGMASRALDEALSHVRQRVQFGQPLSALATVQAMIADMATERDAARLLVARAAWERDVPRVPERPRAQASALAAMAKLYATEAAQRVIDAAVQLHGGAGVLAGSVVEALYRDVRPLRIYEGASEVQRLVIARGLLGARRAPGGGAI